MRPENPNSAFSKCLPNSRFGVQRYRLFFFSEGVAFGLLDGRFVSLPPVKKLVFVKETKVVGEKCFCSGNTEIYNFG